MKIASFLVTSTLSFAALASGGARPGELQTLVVSEKIDPLYDASVACTRAASNAADAAEQVCWERQLTATEVDVAPGCEQSGNSVRIKVRFKCEASDY